MNWRLEIQRAVLLDVRARVLRLISRKTAVRANMGRRISVNRLVTPSFLRRNVHKRIVMLTTISLVHLRVLLDQTI